ncbi:hypothetical protein CAEBREN_06432 [Caenorhabditis brenneri]|uniref:Uncharacterized protein n=1 Tax=Caenorhabditis brenneri TaxID=135651 RepID=G0NT78_CAEBE|nr:hypothetical protein CAEBREN_06432 [Caenorhabditis brenneri]
MDDNTPRIGGPFPFMCPTPSPSSAVFPNIQMLSNMQQMQQQLQFHCFMQMVQQQQRLSAGTSPVNSDQASSRSESPQSKKLILDEDGCATCSVCSEKVPEAEWNNHIDLEKERLITYITSTKEKRERENTPDQFDQKRKRELELQRIRNNQNKRQSLKRGLVRDCLTPFSRQSNDETGSSESPDMKKDDEFFMKCTTCHQPCSYAIVMSAFDRPKCQLCFDHVRAAVLTSTGSPESRINKDEQDSSPVCKKMKIEDLIDTSA